MINSGVPSNNPLPTSGVGVSAHSALTGLTVGDDHTQYVLVATGSADPTGVVTPSRVGEVYIDETNDDAYVAVGTTSADWAQIDGSGGAVDSVNGQTGVVVLDADDIDDSATSHRFATAAQLTKLDGVEVGATADQTGAEIKAAYEGEADTNAFTDADHSKLDAIEASATANPRTALSIFEATLSSATQNCNGAQGSTFDFTWTASVNNATYITSFTNGNSVITLTEAGEYVVDTAIIVLNSALSGRLIWTGQVRHENSSAVEQYTHTLAGSYIRDQAAGYDSGGVAGQVTVFAAAGDQIKIRRVVLDTANSASNVYADQTETKVRIQKID